MSFAVYGVDKIKLRELSVRVIDEMEVYASDLDRTSGEGVNVLRHLSNCAARIVDCDQHEAAVFEKMGALHSSARRTRISPKYDNPGSARKYLSMLSADGGNGVIKQYSVVVDSSGNPEFGKSKSPKKAWKIFKGDA